MQCSEWGRMLKCCGKGCENMKKNLIAVPALCGAGLFLLCGCFSGDNARDDLLNYLEARYTQDDFTFHSYELQPEQNELKKTEICVSSKLFPDADLRALRWQKDGKWVYRDNYMAYYLHDDVEAYMHDIAESIFGACKVYLDSPWGVYTPESYPTDADAEYYLKSKPQCGFAVYLPPGQSKESAARNQIFRNAGIMQAKAGKGGIPFAVRFPVPRTEACISAPGAAGIGFGILNFLPGISEL